MFYALVPLVFWALFALRNWRPRGPLVLGLVLAVGGECERAGAAEPH
jgi:hypothetical protein